MDIIAPASVAYTGNPTTYTVEITGNSPSVTEESLWVRQDVFDVEDADVDLAQYARVSNRIATLTLGPTPSWPTPPGGGGTIFLQLLSLNGKRRDKVLAEATVTLLP